jgi:hypothetical protein
MFDPFKRKIFQAATWAGATGDITDTVIVAGAPRSGTTWIAELLREVEGYKMFNEPLFLANYPEAREAGFSWRTHIPVRTRNPEAEAYLRKVLTGRVPLGPGWRFRHTSASGKFIEHVTQQRMLVKFCRAGRLLRWMLECFDVRGTLFVIRHPCAVVASQLNHGGWDSEHLDNGLGTDAALGEVPAGVYERYSDLFASLTTRVEVLAAIWCLDYHIPLLELEKEYPWILLPYERMVTQGAEELQRIAAALEVDVSKEMHRQLDEPSVSVTGQVHQNSERQLSKWRRRLSEKQIDSILRVVDEMGFSFLYGREVEPNYKKMNRFQASNFRW